MDEFNIEFYIEKDEDENIKLSSLNDNELKRWKMGVETRALSEYYNEKIEISN